MKIVSVEIIRGLDEVKSYIENSFIGNPKIIAEITSLDEIKQSLIKDANKSLKDDFREVEMIYQVQCVKRGERVHLFKEVDIYGNALFVEYIGTTK